MIIIIIIIIIIMLRLLNIVLLLLLLLLLLPLLSHAPDIIHSLVPASLIILNKNFVSIIIILGIIITMLTKIIYLLNYYDEISLFSELFLKQSGVVTL